MKIFKVKKNKDGSATIVYGITKYERKLIKIASGVKRLTVKTINKIIIEALEKLTMEVK